MHQLTFSLKKYIIKLCIFQNNLFVFAKTNLEVILQKRKVFMDIKNTVLNSGEPETDCEKNDKNFCEFESALSQKGYSQIKHKIVFECLCPDCSRKF